MSLLLLVLAIIPAFITLPTVLYHFLIFPNIDGVVQDLSWYNYDSDSKHFLYWVGFYASGVFGGILGASTGSSNK
jgi:hypothetical protein